ncbi:MAG TPA: DUF4870 domain-containing protein [Bacteroidia bacterium]|nr:DUF4870 domain-containing protein [Bacteroidia bacterium]
MQEAEIIPDNDDMERGKLSAVLSYCTLVGWIVGYVLHQGNKTAYAAFHLRQSIGLAVSALAIMVAFWMTFVFLPFGWMAMRIVNIAYLVFMIIGIINAASGKMKKLPLAGDFFDKIFSSIN